MLAAGWSVRLLAAPAGEVTTLSGQATAASPSGDIRALQEGSTLEAGDTVNTLPNSYLRMKLADGGYVMLRPDSRFVIEDFVDARDPARDRSAFNLLKGGLRAVTGLIARRNAANYRVRSPVATIGIRGSDFELRLCQGDCLDVDPPPPDGAYATVHRDGIFFSTNAGTTEVDPGEFVYAPGPDDPPAPITAGQATPLTSDPLPPADPADCP